MGGTHPKPLILAGRAGVIPMRITTILTLAIILSCLFIMSISFAFLGEDDDEPHFKQLLGGVAQNSPGIVLLGESVDVDVDEPSVTVRWSIIGCGDGYVLANSSGIGGSSACGLPSMALGVFIDGNLVPDAVYDPTQLPFVVSTGKRRNIQNLVQFESDHVLDVHESHLYPFDTYIITSTLHAMDSQNQSVPIQKLAVVDQTGNFLVATSDVASYRALPNGTQILSRDIDLRIKRPAQARAFTLILFSITWVLTHTTIGFVALAWYTEQTKISLMTYLAFSFGILLVIPQLRDSMPDAPGYDGFLIDYIGLFPQVIFIGLSIIVLLVLLISYEFDLGQRNSSDNAYTPPPTSQPPSLYKGLRELSKSRAGKQSFGRTSSIHMGHNDLARLIKHLNGEFVYPLPNATSPQIHRRNLSSKFEQTIGYSSWTKNSGSRNILTPVEEDPKYI